MIEKKMVGSLKKLIAEYEKERAISFELEDFLLKNLSILENYSSYFFEKHFLKKERKTLYKILLDISNMANPRELPTGLVLEKGFGSCVLTILKNIMTGWQRLYRNWLELILGITIVSLLTKWIFNSFVAGIVICIFSRIIGRIFDLVASIYRQNEVLLKKTDKEESI